MEARIYHSKLKVTLRKILVKKTHLWGKSSGTHDLGELHNLYYPFVYGVKVLLFVKVVTTIYITLILFLSIDPSLMY
jgi:hypothetical protein